MVWPLFVWTPERQREVRAVTLLREVLSDRVRRIVREKFGQTYTPDVSYVTERGGDDGALTVAIETHPEAVQQVVNEVRAIARELARGNITADELERILALHLAVAGVHLGDGITVVVLAEEQRAQLEVRQFLGEVVDGVGDLTAEGLVGLLDHEVVERLGVGQAVDQLVLVIRVIIPYFHFVSDELAKTGKRAQGVEVVVQD